MDQLPKLWRTIVLNFTCRGLSRSEDRLPATFEISQLVLGYGTGRYLAGLWSNYLQHHLLWNSKPRRSGIEPPPKLHCTKWAATIFGILFSRGMTDYDRKGLKCPDLDVIDAMISADSQHWVWILPGLQMSLWLLKQNFVAEDPKLNLKYRRRKYDCYIFSQIADLVWFNADSLSDVDILVTEGIL
jgi:hypothetical protein